MDYNKIFEDSHDEGVDLLGKKWLSLNEKAANVASHLGVDHRDKNMRAFISKLVLEISKGMLELDNFQKANLANKLFISNKK